jgi:hypothetical protein
VAFCQIRREKAKRCASFSTKDNYYGDILPEIVAKNKVLISKAHELVDLMLSLSTDD